MPQRGVCILFPVTREALEGQGTMVLYCFWKMTTEIVGDQGLLARGRTQSFLKYEDLGDERWFPRNPHDCGQ